MSCGKPCECPSYRDHCLSIGFSATAMPSRTQNAPVAAAADKEKQLNKDLPAYKRMRNDGLRPRHVDGSSNMESRASDPVEVNDGKLYGKSLPLVKEAKEVMSGAA